MTSLKPLEQFICDECKNVIDDVRDGWVEWKSLADGKAGSFRIIHHFTESSFAKSSEHGYYSRDSEMISSMHLENFVGPKGIVYMLTIMNAGPEFSVPLDSIGVDNVHDWMNIFRRIHVPYYEEALLYWSRAKYDGFFEGANEIWTYSPDNLQRLVERYRA